MTGPAGDGRTRVLACVRNDGQRPVRLYKPGLLGPQLISYVHGEPGPVGVEGQLTGRRRHLNWAVLPPGAIYGRELRVDTVFDRFAEDYGAECSYVIYEDGHEGDADRACAEITPAGVQDVPENTTLRPPLARATVAGDRDAVESLLKGGAAVDEEDPLGRTALMFAAAEREGEILDHLLRANAAASKRSANGVTVLMYAASEGGPGVVRRLLEAGADANACTPRGYTALMEAAAHGQTETVALLLANGARVNVQSDLGRTALMYASDGGWDEVVRVLLGAGARADITDYEGNGAIEYARRRGYPCVVEVLRRG